MTNIINPPSNVPLDVAFKFEDLALQLWSRGWRHFSADAILHRIRWEFTVERNDGEWKCNNNHTPALARWFMTRHPHTAGFFALRSRREAA